MESNNKLQTTETNEQSIVKRLSQSKFSQLILENKFDEASATLPTTIKQVFDQPKIREQILAIGEVAVILQLKFELNILADLINTGGNLNDPQIQFIAESLIEMFPNESIADFKLCFKRGAMGVYGPIQRLDGVTIGEWMKNYLEEKYGILESMHRKVEITQIEEKPKAEPIKTDPTPLSDEEAKKRLTDWARQLEDVTGPKKIQPLTPQEIRVEGQDRPVSLGYISLTTEQVLMKQEIRKAAQSFYKGRPNFDKFEVFLIDQYEVFAANREDAANFCKAAYEIVQDKLKQP